MTVFDAFRYDGKRVVVVGGATGMGAATAELALDAGAEVVVMDFAEVAIDGVKSIHVNLADKDSIDSAVDTCGGPVHALFSCAGVADGTPNIHKINFVGHRHLIDRMRAGGMLDRGSAIGFISSAAGLGWEANLDLIKELLAIPDFDGAAKWIEDQGKADYYWSKQFICAYVAHEAMSFLRDGIRLNAICPGPTDTPLLADIKGPQGMERTMDAIVRATPLRKLAEPADIAAAVCFLAADEARFVTGVLSVSGGLTMAG